jgi:hypothetical protein
MHSALLYTYEAEVVLTCNTLDTPCHKQVLLAILE